MGDISEALDLVARRRHMRRVVVILLAVLFPLVIWQTAMWSGRVALQVIRDDGHRRLALYTSNLQSELERYDYLPRILAEDTAVKEVLQAGGNTIAADIANRYLERINTFADASATYVMARDGTTLAASNYNSDRSFVGRNFKFRPYFQMALKGDLGRYFALGTTSLKSGYYLARPVYQDFDTDREIIGVIVVKVGMDRLEKTWDKGPVHVMVTDPDGVAFITSNADWKFRTLTHLPDETRSRIKSSRQYHNAPLLPLDLTGQEDLGGGDAIVSVAVGAGGETEYLMQTAPVAGTEWKIHVLLPSARVGHIVWAATTLAGFGFAIVVLLAFSVTQRRHRLRDRLAYQQKVADALEKARDELEVRVRERTADLSDVNRRLVEEIGERRRAEEDLRTTQAELIQAGKLAVLGKLSTGINHELNQPLSAIRSYADNARAFLSRGRTDDAHENLTSISELTERAASIVTRLKGFARKSSADVRTVPLGPSVTNALNLLAPRFQEDGIEVVTDLGDHEVLVQGGAVRLEQVFVNLFSNAADAMSGRGTRVLSVTLDEDGETVSVRVADTGPGIAVDHLSKVFEPFFTTKEAGVGLGIGLAISYSIVRNFGGTMEVANRPKGGAVFTVQLLRPETASGAGAEAEGI